VKHEIIFKIGLRIGADQGGNPQTQYGYSTDTVLILLRTCSWWVTTYMGKPSAIGQPTRPTQPFILSGSINEYWAAIRCSPPHLVEVPSGERLRRKGRHGVLCRLIAVWYMPERFRVVCNMQGAIQVLWLIDWLTFTDHPPQSQHPCVDVKGVLRECVVQQF